MAEQNANFKERVSRNLEISKHLQQEPWKAFELDRDPEVLSAVMAHHADFDRGWHDRWAPTLIYPAGAPRSH